MARNLPPKVKPKGIVYDAYVVDFGATPSVFTNAYIGIETPKGDKSLAVAKRLELIALLGGAAEPDVIECGAVEDDTPPGSGRQTEIFHLYWADKHRFDAWLASPEVEAWLRSASGTDAALWMEVAQVLSDQVETAGSHPMETGMGKLIGGHRTTDVHGYWGGMYDRVPAYKQRDLNNPLGPTPQLGNAAGRLEDDGIVTVAMPANVCLTNGNAQWTGVSGHELDFYFKELHPALIEANRYLRDEPDVANTYASRFMRMTTLDGKPQERICMLVYFVSLDDLHAWTGRHKTHQHIFGLYQRAAREIGGTPAYQLWHEVSVLPEGHLWGVYANCSEDTGFLKYGALRAGDLVAAE
ncbi:MAG: phenylacetaldoxime dehydratase family protein [Pseudomonadota bacterium]